MRIASLLAVAVGVCGLAAGVAAAPGSVAAGPAATGPAGFSVTALADVAVRPGVQHVGRAQASPPTTADCEKSYKVACYSPAQIRQAYHLPAVYAGGVTGQGTTIVIVDSFGSPPRITSRCSPRRATRAPPTSSSTRPRTTRSP